MFQYTIVQWLFFFYLYCILGWCFETTYVSLKSKKYVNRGFMRGPFLPIYGSGAIMMLVVSAPFQSMVSPTKQICTYFAGCLGATILEYVTGVTMEALFKVRYWDYSGQKFNFQGHICLSSTIAWGFFTLLMTEFLHKPIESLVLVIPGTLLSVVTLILTAFIGADFALSFKAAMDLRDILVRLDKLRTEMAHIQKRLDVIIALAEEDIAKHKEELDQLHEKYRMHLTDHDRIAEMKDILQKRILRSNPSLRSVHFAESLQELQDKLEEEFKEKKEQLKQRIKK